jgi:signal peptidase I
LAKKKVLRKSKAREYTEAIIIAVILALLIRAFVVQAFKIPSGSMEDTLLVGDHILVSKFIYGTKIPFTDTRLLIFNPPKRGDVVVFSFPGNDDIPECTSAMKNFSTRIGNVFSRGNPVYIFKDECRDFIKRVVGVGGDRIEIKDKIVYVNDMPLTEPYKIHREQRIAQGERDNFGPFTVPRRSLFVMGDNRDHSYDSRFWGIVDMSKVKGKAFIMYWSWDKDGSWFSKVRWSRIGQLLH